MAARDALVPSIQPARVFLAWTVADAHRRHKIRMAAGSVGRDTASVGAQELAFCEGRMRRRPATGLLPEVSRPTAGCVSSHHLP